MLGLKASPDAEADADDVIHWVNNKDKLSLLQLDRDGKSECLERERERESGALMYAELAVVFGKERFVILMQWADKKLAKGAAPLEREYENWKIHAYIKLLFCQSCHPSAPASPSTPTWLLLCLVVVVAEKLNCIKRKLSQFYLRLLPA